MDIETRLIFQPSDGFRSSRILSDIENGTNVEEDGLVLWGPYIELPSGSWVVEFIGEFSSESDTSFCDVCADFGLICLAKGDLESTKGVIGRVEFHNTIPMANVEFRVNTASGDFISINNIVISRIENSASTVAITAIPSAGRHFDIYKRHGMRLILDRSSHVDRCIIENGSWEHEQIVFLTTLISRCSNISEKKVFLDIGSYFGLYSLNMARTAFFNEIHAFEADILNFRQLQANLLINDADLAVKAHNFAVSDRAGEASFFPSWKHPHQNRGGVGLISPDHGSVDPVIVPTKALDDIIDIEGGTIFAKIDVEGSELSVLQGMRDILTLNRCVLQMEALIFNEKDRDNLNWIEEFIFNIGYSKINSIDPDNYYSNFLDNI